MDKIRISWFVVKLLQIFYCEKGIEVRQNPYFVHSSSLFQMYSYI